MGARIAGEADDEGAARDQVRERTIAMIRGRVGRHTQAGGRQCQNWSDDQKFVIALLNLISISDGGAGGHLDVGGRIVAGIASDTLCRAISTFEDRHFPRQRSGFVDPGGGMLRRMEEIVARSVKAPAIRPRLDPIVVPPPIPVRTSLDRALDNVFIDAPWSSYPVAQRNAFTRVVGLAVLYIEALKAQGMTGLPYQVVLFGRAYLTTNLLPTTARGSLEFINDKGGTEHPPLIERFGAPIDLAGDITTGKDVALLLYANTVSYRVFPYHTGRIPYLQDMNSGQSWTKAHPLKP
jgi:hypothetical protein